MRDAVNDLLRYWDRMGKPTREDYLKGASQLDALRGRTEGNGLWAQPPLMVTATLDDGWGHGVAVIESLATAVGVRIHALGVLQPPAAIVKACRDQQPDLLGLTVLQFDSDEDLMVITAALPPRTTLIAGGAAYRYDSDFAKRTGTHAVAHDGRAFLRFLRDYRPLGQPRHDDAP